MLVSEVHQTGGTWIFYVVAPVILCGVVASLWLIVKGAIGVFGRSPRRLVIAHRRSRQPDGQRGPASAPHSTHHQS